MNKLSAQLAIAFFLLTATLSAASIWGSWDGSVEKAKKEHKLILIKAVQDGCHYCDSMERKVFSLAWMQRYVLEHFIPVSINISKDKLPLNLDWRMTPSFYFLDADQKLVKFIPGSWNAQDFHDFLKNIVKEQK